MRKLYLPCIIAAALLATQSMSMAARQSQQPSSTRSSKSASSALAKPTPIYRCGNNYQSSPCEQDKSSTPQALVFHDRQSADQVKAAKQSQTLLNKQAMAIDKKQAKEMIALQRHPPQAIGLDCRPLGARPFEHCKTKGTAKKSTKAAHKERKERIAQAKQGPFIARAPLQP